MADNLFNKVYNPDVLSCLANLSNDEVFTPPEIVNRMLDMLPQELFRSPDTTFLDPACKTGVFLREIARRLIKGLEPLIPDLQERIDHIFHKQLFGIAITELTSLLSRRGVYCSKYPNGEFSVSRFDTAEGNIRYITVSPEVAGVCEAIPDMRALGMTVAIGHSGADYETAWRCIRNGAAASTHTMNAMKLMHQHFPAIMGAVLESDIYCEAICDGRHLHPGTVRFLIKMKGIDRMVAITDSIMAAGLPDGSYKLGVNDVVVKDGDAKLKDGTRAGSTLTTGQALKNIIRFTGLTLAQVLPMLTINPARLIGADKKIGSLTPGKDADVVILDESYNVKDTFVKGVRIIR